MDPNAYNHPGSSQLDDYTVPQSRDYSQLQMYGGQQRMQPNNHTSIRQQSNDSNNSLDGGFDGNSMQAKINTSN